MAFGIADGSSWFRGPIPTFKEGRRVNTVFTELMPLLRQRAVMITISDVGQGLLRVNIIPRKLVVDGSSDENTALTTPLSITGKAEELDRELPGQLPRNWTGNCPASSRPLPNRSPGRGRTWMN